MAKKEVDERVLAKLLDDSEKLKQQEEKEAESSVVLLDGALSVVLSPGPIMIALGLAAVIAAPVLVGTAWFYGDVAAGLLTIAGQLSSAGGLALTVRSVAGKWLKRRKDEKLAILGRKEPLLLPEA